MALAMGSYNDLRVLRESDLAYILESEDGEVFLHKKQAIGDIKEGDTIRVFLYFDNQKRITATMHEPYVDTEKAAFVDVIDINEHLGAFLRVGLIKDLLLSRDDLSFKKSEWPQVGDKVFVKMKASKHQITAKIIPRYEIKNYLKPETELIKDECYDAYCVFIGEEGVVFSTLEGHYIYVYFKNVRKQYRLGEKAYVKIIQVKVGHQYNGTLIEQKELMLSIDALVIKEYLEKHNGTVALTDKSTPEEIRAIFTMSKAAFKRAIGTLYKEKVVNLESNATSLIKPVE